MEKIIKCKEIYENDKVGYKILEDKYGLKKGDIVSEGYMLFNGFWSLEFGKNNVCYFSNY